MTDNSLTTITPFLTVHNAKKAVAFYKAAFGAAETERFDLPGEKISCGISIEGACFWIGDEEPQFGNLSPGTNTSSPVRIILKTRNADGLFSNAIRLGATQICAMTTEEDWRIGKLKDPFGHIWEIGYILEK